MNLALSSMKFQPEAELYIYNMVRRSGSDILRYYIGAAIVGHVLRQAGPVLGCVAFSIRLNLINV